MAERIVFILGAGFSAPLGIPVMSNFLPVARDLYASGQPDYADFDQVFKRIRALSQIKNYFRVDLENIEEVLSILDMDTQFGDHEDQDKIELVSLIKKVITATTPILKRDPSGNDDVFYHDTNRTWYRGLEATTSNRYGRFVLWLFKRKISANSNGIISFSPVQTDRTFSVITLNNDMVLETYLAAANALVKNQLMAPAGPDLRFVDKYGLDSPLLAKLHGSVDGEIIPPASQKILTGTLRPVWKEAFRAVRNANHIHFVGYSLPATDVYIRYFLKAALEESPNLKRIVVHDKSADAKRAYLEFIDFKRFAFEPHDAGEIVDQLPFM
jgi:hypothetical protein